MSPQAGRAGIQIAVWIVIISLLLLPFLDRSSAEFYLTAFCLIAGLVFGSVVWFLTRRSMK
jgi:hypothetical protein